MALDYPDEHHFMRIQDYAILTELRRTAAREELHLFANDPASGIKRIGRGNQMMFVKR